MLCFESKNQEKYIIANTTTNFPLLETANFYNNYFQVTRPTSSGFFCASNRSRKSVPQNIGPTEANITKQSPAQTVSWKFFTMYYVRNFNMRYTGCIKNT